MIAVALGKPLPIKKEGHTPVVTFYYFGVLGRADPLTQIFEYHGQPYKKHAYDFPEWEAIKKEGGGGEFGGGLPQADFVDP